METTFYKRHSHRLTTFIVFLYTMASFSSADLREVCQSETFKANCLQNQIIMMESAMYGRMNIGRCVEANLGYIGCHKNVLDLADKWCSGQRSCGIQVPNTYLDSTKPCFKELKTYFEASYRCVNVAMAQKTLCKTSTGVKVSATEGYISSLVSEEIGCGSSQTPWVIEAQRGQRINITLLDFNTLEDPNQERYYSRSRTCKKYAFVKERLQGANLTICGGHLREENMYYSTSHRVEISIIKPQTDSSQFLLHYEVIGCKDLPTPPNAYFKRKGGHGVVGCITSDKQWEVICDGTKWIGKVGNCTRIVRGTTSKNTQDGVPLPYGISIMIIIGLAIAIGTVILIIGLVCFARQRRACRARQSTAEPEPIYQKHASAPGTYKIYQKAPCHLQEPASPQPFLHPLAPGNYSGNDYAHIWESPLPEPRAACSMSDGAYGTKYECAYAMGRGAHGTLIGMRTTLARPTQKCVKVQNPVPPDDNLEGNRYYILDKDSNSGKESPDVVPMPLDNRG